MNYVDTPPSQISSGQEMLLNAIDCAEAAEKGQLYERENDFGESTSSEYEIEEEEEESIGELFLWGWAGLVWLNF